MFMKGEKEEKGDERKVQCYYDEFVLCKTHALVYIAVTINSKSPLFSFRRNDVDARNPERETIPSIIAL